MTRGLVSNDDGQVGMFIPAVPYLIIFVGLALAITGSLGIGLVLMGFGTLLLGVGGAGSLGYGSVRITGPVGLLLVVIGIAVIYYF